ncbi:MAG: glycosyltransferase family 2 protein [Lachnospiraceae bacterium]|nr:glycosyltransferase family 2 protein [Lachnospiraceae bacterium]
MTVSIIAAFFNVGAYAEECVSSISGQSYKDLDIILVDDGSTDDTGKILDEWASKDSRIRVIHEENKGLSFARNAGMRVAKGDAFAFIDGDDAVRENYIETLVLNMESSDADLSVVGRYENNPGTDEFILVSPVKEFTTYNDYTDYVYAAYADRTGAFFVSAVVAWGKLYKKTLWEGVEFPVGRISEDAWVFPQILSRCQKIVVAPDNLYFYRRRKGSIMSSGNEKLYCAVIESWLHQVKWWYEHDGNRAGKLLSACEKRACNYMFTHAHDLSDSNKGNYRNEYKLMIRHMLLSVFIPLRTKIKYLTFARPGKVFK